MSLRRYMNIVENAQDTETVWHLTTQDNVREIMTHGLDPEMTRDGDKAVYVWVDWGDVVQSVKTWCAEGDSDLDVILQLTVPADWLTPGHDELEPHEFLIYRPVPPEMIRVLVPSICDWDGSIVENALEESLTDAKEWHWMPEAEKAEDDIHFQIAAKFSVPGFEYPYYVCFDDYSADLGKGAYSMFFAFKRDRLRTFPERTGTGFAVFSTIADITAEFIREHGATALRMSGQVGKQTKLYKRIAERLLSRLPGWEVQETHEGVILRRV